MEERIRSGLPTEDIKPDDDPMDEMVPVCQTPEPRKKKQAFVTQVCRLRMPEWPGEAMKGNATIEREVRVLLDGNGKLWIHTGDIEWLIRSLWTMLPRNDEGPGAPQPMEPDLTPEKKRRPEEDEGHLFAKWGTEP